jgi:lysophospholipase L1-like esterase
MAKNKPTPKKPSAKKTASTKRQPREPRAVKASVTVSAKPLHPAKLSSAQQAEFEKWSNAGFTKRRQKARAATLAGVPALRQFTVVAEGDSWFDYKPSYIEGFGAKDLLGHLQSSGRINVHRVSEAGDTMENMVYGTGTTGDGPNLRPEKKRPIDETLKAIRDKNPDAFFFSGGGNDLAGVELASYLNHKDWGSPAIRQQTLDHVFGVYFEKALADLIAQVRAAKPGIPIFFHGYDYAVPDGRGVINLFGWTFKGPWLKPALVQKRHLSPEEGHAVMVQVLDRFNSSLKNVAAAHAGVHYINLLGTLRSAADYKRDWANELHPTSDGFRKLAAIIERAMLDVLEK